MDKQKQLNLKIAKQNVQQKEAEQRQARSDEEASKLEKFVADLAVMLDKGIRVDGIEGVDNLVCEVERFGETISELIERIVRCTSSVSNLAELNVPEAIELKGVADQRLLDVLEKVGDNGELLSKFDSLNTQILVLQEALTKDTSPGQTTQDYLPVRIVLGREGALRFLESWPTPYFAGTQTGGGTSGGLTDEQLRASPVPVSASIDTTGLATDVNQTTIIGHVDGIETLIGATNTALTTIDGRVDTLETLIAATNTKLDSVIAAQKTDWGLNDQEETGTYKYFGFESPSGSWKITRKTLADGSFRYATGASNYSTAWTGRAGQTYDYYGVTF